MLRELSLNGGSRLHTVSPSPVNGFSRTHVQIHETIVCLCRL